MQGLEGVAHLRVHDLGHGHGAGGEGGLVAEGVGPAVVQVVTQGAVQGLAVEAEVELVGGRVEERLGARLEGLRQQLVVALVGVQHEGRGQGVAQGEAGALAFHLLVHIGRNLDDAGGQGVPIPVRTMPFRGCRPWARLLSESRRARTEQL